MSQFTQILVFLWTDDTAVIKTGVGGKHLFYGAYSLVGEI